MDPKPSRPVRPVATYSIVARDASTGDLGVAVQSHWFSVGSLVTWAEAGVGAVATQSFVEVGYGPRGLEALRDGEVPAVALERLLDADADPTVRQVAFVDASGRVAAHTGERCVAAAGHQLGEDFSVQANLMRSDAVWPAMAQAFVAAEGDLSARLLAALEAGEAAGGDIRGRQSAALLVVDGERHAEPWQGRKVELRVEDHPQPLEELRRLLEIHRAYDHMNRADAALTAGDVEEAFADYDIARRLYPENPELGFWAGIALCGVDRVDEGLPLLRAAFDADPAWRELVPRLPTSGLLSDDASLLRRILESSS